MFDLRGVVSYLAPSVGLTPGRIWFGAGYAINVTLTAKQRRNFLRFLNRHGLKRFLVVDNLHPYGKPAVRIGAGPAPGLTIEVDPRQAGLATGTFVEYSQLWNAGEV